MKKQYLLTSLSPVVYGKLSIYFMEHLCHVVRENRGAEAYFAERSSVFATKPPSRKLIPGSYESNRFTGRGNGGWVAVGNIPYEHPGFVFVSRYQKQGTLFSS
jgi:hypothetical protein